MWTGLWQKRCKYSETAVAIAYEQHGFFEQAQVILENVSIRVVIHFVFWFVKQEYIEDFAKISVFYI